ncbi:MAG: type II toxin-antitoxin system HicB family antitoxin [Thiobacillus sp.]|nr:type II toxin-antitoxin system HicB family antitoxin [Thiobacillus sp.]
MTHQFDVVVEKDSAGYFVASVPVLPGCHTQAKSLDDLMERIREAIELYASEPFAGERYIASLPPLKKGDRGGFSCSCQLQIPLPPPLFQRGVIHAQKMVQRHK